MNQASISRFATKEEVRQLIEKEQLRLAESIPDAVQNVKDLVKEMPAIPKHEVKQRELAYKATKDVLKAAGIFPSPSINLAIYNDTRQVNIEPEVLYLLTRSVPRSLKKEEFEESGT